MDCVDTLRAVKALTVILTSAVLALAGAPAAHSADLQTCRSESASSDAPGYKRLGRPVRSALGPDAKAYLGAQYTATWLQADDAGWYVGVAPGKRSLKQTRAWVAAWVERHYQGEDAKLIRSRLHVIRQPYGMAELREVGSQIYERLAEQGLGPQVNWGGDEACTLSDAYRSEITLYADSTRADLREMRRELADLGDRVRVTRVNYEMDDSVD
ncbi:hypothetical protein OJ998_11605 [Solirubrobacter taibaiensis]|nr:hypothetical protein [Solirubrobacter taibaiensis]